MHWRKTRVSCCSKYIPFPIPALSYYDAFHEEEALKAAFELFRLIELKCRDEVGYKEAQSREFFAVSNETGNRPHFLYIYLISKNFCASVYQPRCFNIMPIRMQVNQAVHLIVKKNFLPFFLRIEYLSGNRIKHPFQSFRSLLPSAYTVKFRIYEIYIKKMRPITRALEDMVYQTAYTNHSLANECECGTVNELRIWWVQAEWALPRFYNRPVCIRHSVFICTPEPFSTVCGSREQQPDRRLPFLGLSSRASGYLPGRDKCI